jgi:hypothetical protein
MHQQLEGGHIGDLADALRDRLPAKVAPKASRAPYSLQGGGLVHQQLRFPVTGALDYRPLVLGLPPTLSDTLQLQASGALMTRRGMLPSTAGSSLMLLISAALLSAFNLLGFDVLRRFS